MTTLVRTPLSAILGCALAHAAVAQPPMGPTPTEMMKRADTDGDGAVSREEFIKARSASIEEMFDRMDANGDGKLDEQEIEAAAAQMRPMPGGREGFRRPDGPRPPRPGSERPPRPDGDRPPFPGGGGIGPEAFDRLDGDGDGRLSREEFAAGMARMRDAMQRGGRGPGRPDMPERRGPEEGFRRPPQQD